MLKKQRGIGLLLAFALFGPSSPRAAADITPSDSNLLTMIQGANEANLSQIRTWSGKATISDTLMTSDPTRGGPVDLRVESTASFAVDTVRNMKHWRWTVLTAQEQPSTGAAMTIPDRIETHDEMLRPDGYFNLAKGFLPRGSQEWQRSLVIWPPSHPPDRPLFDDHTFDPFTYMYIQEKTPSAYIQEMRPFWLAMINATFNGEHIGSLVKFKCISDRDMDRGKIVYSWTVDLACGGNVVQYYSAGGGHPTTIEISYTNVLGIWVPLKYSKDNDRGKTRSNRVVNFANAVINQPLPENEFTIENMGVIAGTRVTDQRSQLFYKYGDESNAVTIGENRPPTKR